MFGQVLWLWSLVRFEMFKHEYSFVHLYRTWSGCAIYLFEMQVSKQSPVVDLESCCGSKSINLWWHWYNKFAGHHTNLIGNDTLYSWCCLSLEMPVENLDTTYVYKKHLCPEQMTSLSRADAILAPNPMFSGNIIMLFLPIKNNRQLWRGNNIIFLIGSYYTHRFLHHKEFPHSVVIATQSGRPLESNRWERFIDDCIFDKWNIIKYG
jgi:hypothetical protein